MGDSEGEQSESGGSDDCQVEEATSTGLPHVEIKSAKSGGSDNCQVEEATSTGLPHVEIKSARGLQNLESPLELTTFCTCEVEDKPETKIQTQALAATSEPSWNFKHSVKGFVPGDSLVFSLWTK